MAYDKEQALLNRLNNKSKDELIEIILKKDKQINRLNGKISNAKAYIYKLKECIMTLKNSRFVMSYYSTHYFTKAEMSDKDWEEPIPLNDWR